MIYLTNGNMPLNAAYSDEIVQEDNSTYQLSFRFPTSDPLWEKLKEEAFLTADDLHGEQEFVIFEVEKKHGYIQVYANQVFTILNNYVVSSLALDRATGSTALSRFAGAITRDNPFSFFSDIEDRHTFNIGSKNAMEAFAKDKHSIIGQWGGDLVRHGYQVRLLKNGGSENESLFMYKKNLSSYQHKTSTKSLKTRITFTTTVKGEGEKAPDRTFTVTIDSPLINKYSQIYEDVIEVNDQDVKDEASLRKYGEQYYRTSLCDMMEDSLEIEVVGRSDVPVQMFDVVSIFHEQYNLDVRKKITKYTYSPMAKKLKSIGFGQFQSGLANAIGNAVSDAVKGEAQQLQSDFERQLARELKNADLDFDRKKEELVNQFQDGMGAAYSKAEEVRMEILDTIDQRFSNFDNGPLQEVNRRAEEALQNAGASGLLAQEAKRIGLDSITKLEEFKRQTFNTQSALSGAIDALKRTVTNDIRPKQAQAEAEIAKQVEALIQTKNELAGVKSAQATYEETTTRRLSELTNLANGKASKSELTQTAEELASKIASVQIAYKNQGDRVSAVESNFKQRADALDAGVSRLTEGLRTKADISSLNVTAENIRQSVKSLETNTQNKLDQKLSTAEFEVRAGSIRQEILNATKDKADKTLVLSEAGKIREEFSKMKVGGRNYAEDYDFSRGLWQYSQGDSSPQDWTILNGEYNVQGTTKTWKQLQIYSKEGSRASGKNSTALLELEAGETYTLSFQGICYSGSSNVWASLRANRTVPGNPEIINGNFKLTSSWQTYQVTIPALTKPDNFDVWRIILGYSEIGHVAFRKVELTRSSTRIDAGPAPEDGKTDLVVAKSEFQKTAEGLRTDLSAIQEYVNKDGQRQETLQRYTREESARQVNAVRELVNRYYVGKSTYQEDVRAIERKFEAITNPQNGSIATQIANYKNAVDGRFADITSLISGKANQTDFQRVKETSQLYERILGNTDNGIANNVARMALTNQLFQVEVAKASSSGRNLFLNSLFKRDLREKYSTYKLYDDNTQTKRQLAVSIDSDNQFRGVNTLKIVSTFNGKIDNQKITFAIGGNGRTGRDDEFKNKSVRFSFWAKSTVNNTNFQARAGYRGVVKGVSLTTDWQFYDVEFVRNENSNATSELILHVLSNATVWIAFPKIEIGTVSTPFSEAPEDTDEAIRSVQSQLAGSWAVQNLTSAGSIVSQINATNNQILIEAEKIRLKGKTLLDELTAIQGYFKRLFVGEGTFATLNADVIRTNSITADKLVMDMAMARRFVSSDLFTDTLAAKEAFINKLRSVVVTATLLEGYRGRIGGFQIGTHDNDPSSFWLTGLDQFKVGMSNGRGREFQTAFWANWGNTWGKPGALSWYVTLDGQMYCNNDATFHRIVDFSSTCSVNFYGANSFYKDIYMRSGSEIYGTGSTPRAGGKNSVVWWNQVGDGSVKYHIDRASDKRLKENIVDSNIVALDKIKQLKMKSFDFISTGKHEEVGLIAQEVEAVLPSVISKNPEKADDYLHIDYVAIVPYLIKSIQELNQKIEEMEKTVA